MKTNTGRVRVWLSLDQALAHVEQQEALERQAWHTILQETLAECGCPVAITADQLMRLEARGMMLDFATGKVDIGLFEPGSAPAIEGAELEVIPAADIAVLEWVLP